MSEKLRNSSNSHNVQSGKGGSSSSSSKTSKALYDNFDDAAGKAKLAGRSKSSDLDKALRTRKDDIGDTLKGR